MKKIMKVVGVVFILIICFICKNVNASVQHGNYMYVTEHDIYYERVGASNTTYLQFKTYYVAGSNVYCIEPLVGVTESYYTEYTDYLNVTGLDQETFDKIALYAYYGFGYKDHDFRYQIAAQELIWETVSYYDFIFRTEDNGKGDIIDVSYEKEVIKQLASSHNTLPSFSNKEYYIQNNNPLVLEDSNNLLDNYNISKTENIRVDNNILTISNIKEDMEFNFSETRVLNRGLFVYAKNNSQKMISQGIYLENDFFINVKVIDTKLNVTKLGEVISFENNEIITNYVPLDNTNFDIYAASDIYNNDELIYNKDDYVFTISTNEYGTILEENLYLGDYYLVESKVPEGYELSKEKYYFSLTLDNLEVSITINNELLKGDIEIIKSDTLSGELLPNVHFEIYDEYNNLILNRVTNEEGKIVIENLPIGKYTIKEIIAHEGYILSSELYNVDVENNIVIILEIKNEKIIEIPDTYQNSSIPIHGIVYEKRKKY